MISFFRGNLSQFHGELVRIESVDQKNLVTRAVSSDDLQRAAGNAQGPAEKPDHRAVGLSPFGHGPHPDPEPAVEGSLDRISPASGQDAQPEPAAIPVGVDSNRFHFRE